MRFLLPIAFRYSAVFLQFLTVLLVSHLLNQYDAGVYFICFSVIAVGTSVCGAGCPDGLVKILPERIQAYDSFVISSYVASNAVFSAILCIILVIVASNIALFFNASSSVVVITGLWWLSACGVYFCGQTLVALGKPSKGTFTFYTAMNAASLPIIALYNLMYTHSLESILISCWIGSTVAFVGAAITISKEFSTRIPTFDARHVRDATSVGFPIAVSRLLQASLAWIPVWVCMMTIDAAAASILSVAGRLTVSVTAVIASLRFFVRDEISKYLLLKEWESIAVSARTVAALSTVTTLVVFFAVSLFGDRLIAILFGSEYSASKALFLILLVGSAAESFAGPVDEILKLSGNVRIVLGTLFLAIALQLVIGVYLANGSTAGIAWSQAVSFVAMYSVQLAFLHYLYGVLVYPDLSFGLCRPKSARHVR